MAFDRSSGWRWVARRSPSLALFVGLLLSAAEILPGQTAARMELAVIGNTTGFSDIDRATIQAVFRGERSVWPSRATVVVVLPSARAPFAESFSRDIFGTGRTAMQRFWLALVFQGRANPPVFMDTVDTMIDFVRRTPGAIAMVPLGGDAVPRDLQIRMR